eukprot:2451571-Prymnesium_polylepis.1
MAQRLAALSRSTASHEKKVRPLQADEGVAPGKWSLGSWLAGAGVHRAVAHVIRHAMLCDAGSGLDEGSSAAIGADDDAALRFLRRVKDRESLARLLCTGELLDTVVDLVWAELSTLQRAGAAKSSEVQSKFTGAIELSYEGLDTFFGGLEGIIGSPFPKLLAAMTADHTSGHGTESTDEFVTGNYGVRTVRSAVRTDALSSASRHSRSISCSQCSRVEWLYVYESSETPARLNMQRWPEEATDRLDRAKCRQRRDLSYAAGTRTVAVAFNPVESDN